MKISLPLVRTMQLGFAAIVVILLDVSAVSYRSVITANVVLGGVLTAMIAIVAGWMVPRGLAARLDATHKLRKLNRIYAMVSAINALVMRVQDRGDLFNNACRIAVEDGEFLLAWIGIVDHSENMIVPTAWAGANKQAIDTIRRVFASADGSLSAGSMAAQAIRDKATVISNNVRGDETPLRQKIHVDARVRSIAIFPLIVADRAIGVFVLHTSKPEFFDVAGLHILTELVGNVAFAVDHVEKQERLDHLAYYDALTGLANRRLFLDRVNQYILRAHTEGHLLAVCLIDLERFRKVNATLGRAAGDTLLKLMAEWLVSNAGGNTALARVGADHFAVVLPELRYDRDAERTVEQTSAALLQHPFRLNEIVYRVAAKVGVAMYPEDGSDADALFKNAESALKKAKVTGERYLFYAQKMSETVVGGLAIESRLREALEKRQFVLHYQPKFNIASGKLTGAEALIRWNDPQSGLVPPDRFIPVLEQTGLIHEVGAWALQQALADFQRWRSAGLQPVRIAVNVSAIQLRNRSFVAQIDRALSVAKGAAAGLELEITESLVMEDVEHSVSTLRAIRALGVTIAIDDFGTGFSSLSYLARLPVDTLKIDRSFVVAMSSGTSALTLVAVIINLAHALKLGVIAEGVATEEQLRQLRQLQCDEMQGFLSGKPVPVEVFEQRHLARMDASSSSGTYKLIA